MNKGCSKMDKKNLEAAVRWSHAPGSRGTTKFGTVASNEVPTSPTSILPVHSKWASPCCLLPRSHLHLTRSDLATLLYLGRLVCEL